MRLTQSCIPEAEAETVAETAESTYMKSAPYRDNLVTSHGADSN